MQYEKYGRICPILVKGILKKSQNISFEIESLQQRIEREILDVKYLSKIMFHVTILVIDCEKRKANFIRRLSIDQIYLNKNELQDANIFIFEEDQLLNDQKQQTSSEILQQLFKKLGFNFNYKIFQQKDYKSEIIEELFKIIYEEKRNQPDIKISQEQILKDIYNVKIREIKYNQLYSKVYIIDKPYFINSQRNIIIVKWIRFPSQFEVDHYQLREIKLLELLHNSENCTQLFCYNNLGYDQFFFMKYYDITLEDLNNKIGKSQVSHNDLIHLIKQMLFALNALHAKQIIHRDLKPQNIMFEYINENQTIQDMRCVLIDFDRSDQIERSEQPNVAFQSYYEGTIPYQPPEGTQDKYESSYDVWQLGYIIQCILLRDTTRAYSKIQKPIEEEEVYCEIFKSDHEKVQQKYSQFYPIIKNMMNLDPKKRPTLEWIKGEILKIN